MEHKKLNLYIAGGITLASFIILFMTAQNSVPFWDCGEYSAAAALLQVPHPPGAPFHTLLGRIFMMFPMFDMALRMNLLSVLMGALTIGLTYLSSVILIFKFRGLPKSLGDKLILYGSSALGALALSFSDTFWFSAVESEVYSFSLFLLALVIWLALQWFSMDEEVSGSEKYFLLIAYIFGLSIGVHQLSLLAFFSVALIYYFKKYEFSLKSFAIFWVISTVVFVIIYKGILTGLPAFFKSSFGITLLIVILAGILYGIFYSYKNKFGILNFGLIAVILIILGYSTYSLIVIRANKGLALNQNNPNSMEKLVSYIGREQYGDWPIVNFDGAKYEGKLFPRRWTQEPNRVARFKNYKSDWDYFVRYQFYNMWFRYLLWNFSGRAGDIQDAPPVLFSDADPKWVVGKNGSLPNKYYSIPFLIGLLGAFYHLYRDRKMGLTVWVLFIITGFGLMVYQNMQDPQPRERDYFFVGSFYVFAIWIAFGLAAILEFLQKRIARNTTNNLVLASILGIGAFAIPVNMLYQNYDDHDRRGNFAAWDFAYNLLQSCPKDAILFTNGDNDTFPVWYLQDAEGVRRDVRLINLSLINADWYAIQLKNEMPYGAKKVPISFSDQEITDNMRKFHEWEKSKIINIPIPKKIYKKFIDEELNNQGPFKSLLSFSQENLKDSSKYPDKISFYVKSFYSRADQSGKIHYAIRNQDLLTLDIIMNNNWERPICFATTNAPDTRIGLDSYLRNEGLVFRLTPFNLNSRYEYVNPKLVYDQLTKDTNSFSVEPKLGYKLRNLDNPKVYLDENGMHIAQNYRSVFMNLAAYLISFPQDTTHAYKVLKLMEKKLPESTVRFDYRVRYNLLNYYRALNKKEDVERVAEAVENDCLKEIEKDPNNFRGQWNPYNLLLDVYNFKKQYDKEIELLNRLQKLNPQNKSLQERMDRAYSLKNPPKDTVQSDTTNK